MFKHVAVIFGCGPSNKMCLSKEGRYLGMQTKSHCPGMSSWANCYSTKQAANRTDSMVGHSIIVKVSNCTHFAILKELPIFITEDMALCKANI